MRFALLVWKLSSDINNCATFLTTQHKPRPINTGSPLYACHTAAFIQYPLPFQKLSCILQYELFTIQVVDSSDVLIHVLDARDPPGTRCPQVEKYLKKEAPHKHLIFVLNKCDLIPTWATVSSMNRSFVCPGILPYNLFISGRK